MPFVPLNSGNSLTQNFGQATDMFRDLFGREVTEIFKDDAGTRRVLLGKGANGFYGLKVSPESVDVYTAADDDLVFNSSQNVFKIVDSGTVTIPVISGVPGSSTVTYTHNLGYIPVVLAFSGASGDGAMLPNIGWNAGGVNDGKIFRQVYTSVVSTTQVTFARIEGATGSIGIAEPIKFFLLQESAN